MSTAGGAHTAFERGAKVGCDAIQIFSKNNNQWAAKPVSAEDVTAFRAKQTAVGGTPIICHASYLLNMASPDDALWERSHGALREEIERAALLGIPALVVHVGSHKGEGMDKGIARVAELTNRVLDDLPASDYPVQVLYETMAGQGDSVGHRFEQLGAIRAKLEQPERTGICVDTCHIFAAGYDFRTAEGYAQVMANLDSNIGLDAIGAFHLNDSVKELGKKVDRHAHIGQGFIGLDGFRHLVNDPRFAAVPGVLETPKGEDMAEDVMNLATLRGLIAQSAAEVGV